MKLYTDTPITAHHTFFEGKDGREIMRVSLTHIMTPQQLRAKNRTWMTNARHRALDTKSIVYVLKADDTLVVMTPCADGKVRNASYRPINNPGVTGNVYGRLYTIV